jgi:hypothetical protein
MARLGDTSCGEVSFVSHISLDCGTRCANYLFGIGNEISSREERIRGGLKYSWKMGVSGTPTTRTSNIPDVP